ncbi:MAG: PAS domain S-box protein [Chloroflexi bacterium]|nr:PAS domain S-box protein [Chloroflexota bacterium]
MMKSVFRFLFGTLRGRLILSVALVHAIMMSLFIVDLTARQRDMLLERQVDEATALSQALATSAAGWIASDDVAGLQELVDAQNRYPEIIFVILADKDGRVLAATDKSRLGQFMLDLPQEASQTVLSSTSAMVDVVVPAMIGERHVGWARVGIGQKAASAKLAQIIQSGIFYTVTAVLIGSIIAWFMGSRITQRLYAIQGTIDVISSGNRLARTRLAGNDEAADMAREFNSMLDTLEERDLELRVSEKRYRSLIQMVQAAIVLHDSQGRILASNPLAQRLLGLSEDQLLGKVLIDPEWHFLKEDNSVMPVSEYPVSCVLAAQQPLRDYVVGICRPGHDKVTWALTNAEPEYNDLGEIEQVIVSFIDITRRKRAEQELLEQARHSQSLLRLSRKLERAQTYTEVLNAAQDEVKAVIGYQNLWAYLLTDDKKYFKALVATGPTSDTVMSENGSATLTIEGDQMLKEIADAKEIVVIEDARTDERTNKELVMRLGNRTLVNVPILLFDRHLGSIGTGTFGDEGVRVPTESERKYLVALASHTAVTLDRIHLLIERRQAEETLQAASSYNRRLIEASIDPLVTIGPDGKITDVNEATEIATGVPRARLIGDDFSNYFTEPQKANDGYRKVLAEGLVRDYPLTIRHISGKTTDVLYNATGYKNAAGEIQGVFAAARDITERKQVEDALRQSESQLNEAQRIAHIGSWQLDIVNNVLQWSEEIYRMFEIDPEKFGASYDAFLDAIHPDDRGAVNFAYTNSLETRTPYAIDHRLQFADGRIKHVHEQCETIYSADGKPIRSLGTVQDITERKQAEVEIRKLNQELEQRVLERTAELENANKELEAFAYSVSHDLRAPLRHIDGFIEMLQNTKTVLDDQSRHYMTVISDSAKKMGALIDDLLLFSRMGRTEMFKSQVDLDELVQDVIQEFKPEAEGRNIQWQISPLPLVTGDRAMLRSVLVNLISNALKFTGSRKIARIEIGYEMKADNEVVFFVRDNGVGFDMNYADKLFGVFQRLHRQEDFEGTGIGLANIRRVISRHGGRTWAEAQVDHGATFYFSLPISNRRTHESV